MKKGGVVTDNGEMSNATLSLTWYPEEELKKHNKNGAVPLSLNDEGYYCDECMKVFAIHNVHYTSMF